MYIKNGICYAGEPSNNMEIVAIKPLDDGMMLLTFSTGEIRLFDVNELKGEAFQPLKHDHAYQMAKLDHGVVTWMDGDIDCAPEYMYAHSYAYDEAGSL